LVLLLPTTEWIMILAATYWVTFMIGMPLQQRLWAAMYPARERGRLLGIVATARYAAGGLAILIAGMMAERTGGLAVVAVAGVFGAGCALATRQIATPDLGAAPSFSVRDSIRAFYRRPILRKVALAQLLFGGGIVAALPLITLVQVDRMGLAMGQIGAIAMAGAIATMLSLVAWGSLADRKGGLVSIQVGSVLGVLALAAYAVAPNVATILLASVLLGLAIAALEVAWPTLIAEHVPSGDQAAAAAGLGAVMGARGLIAPVVAIMLLGVGPLGVTGLLGICAVTTGLGSILYLRITSGGRSGAAILVRSLALGRRWRPAGADGPPPL
jgi:MFS family permease